ncbi:MAG: hypothetical protein GY869_15495 [Planctomycetes bacterium]|nr:hypothetical protein [Planctomycetota bacterium]
MKARFADDHYDPNIGGLFELERGDYRGLGFPQNYDGKLIKALNYGVPRMSVMPDGIRVVFMRRNTEEIRQSYEAFFSKPLRNIEHLERNALDQIEQIKNRRDVLSFDMFWYRSIVSAPLHHFQELEQSGWPIDAKAAAAVVVPQYCRFKIEELDVGI